MEGQIFIEPIAHMVSHFPTKFGIPRQSGLVKSIPSTIVFTPKYRNSDALRGIEGFSHLWVIWQFSQAVREDWSPTIRPPRLGGNQRVGVFASRSPFRPNSLGLSAVELVGTEETAQGTVLHVLGADLLDGTPIFDIKPYLPYGDSIPQATGGYTDATPRKLLQVIISPEWMEQVPKGLRIPLQEVLAQDPRPSYQADPTRIYGLAFGGLEVKFTVAEDTLCVVSVSQR